VLTSAEGAEYIREVAIELRLENGGANPENRLLEELFGDIIAEDVIQDSSEATAGSDNMTAILIDFTTA